MKLMIGGGALLIIALFYGSVSAPPNNINNLCNLFEEKPYWYQDVKASADRWGSTVPIIMAFIYQESKFIHDAKPPRNKIFWVIPGPRSSDAYGYAQARDATWDWYMEETGVLRANRRDFGDAADFVGWYNYMSNKLTGISLRDPYNLYLAYHEGQGGYNKQSYRGKAWLKSIAKRTEQRANRYAAQLKKCQSKLDSAFWWWPF